MSYTVSAEGLALIQEFEGFRAKPAQLPDGNWIVGFSHVRIGGAGADMSHGEAAATLRRDLAPFEQLVNESVTTSLTQSQFDALVSLAFSIGETAFRDSQVLRRVNAGEFVAAACAMDAWRKADVGGEFEVVSALVRRRAAEKALFLKELPHDAAPSAFMRAKLDHAASILGAPIKFATAPVIGAASSKVDAGKRLTEILMAESATEALLLTQVVPPEFEEEEEELATAHAKPVSRKVEEIPAARRIGAGGQAVAQKNFAWLHLNVVRSFENFGLSALLVFGLVLIGIGASIVFNGGDDLVSVAGALALIAPGLAATLMAAFGFWRVPKLAAANA
ncbi:MAG: lysozyme [Caulobacterales bacterium]|jgi:GH24 family phage-related lysozyme (muramidase)|nr:lysozyme [Caulobacterales bacterium]